MPFRASIYRSSTVGEEWVETSKTVFFSMRGSMAGRSAVADANRYVLAPITKKTKTHSPKGQELMDEMDSAVSANLFRT